MVKIGEYLLKLSQNLNWGTAFLDHLVDYVYVQC